MSIEFSQLFLTLRKKSCILIPNMRVKKKKFWQFCFS